MKKVGVLLFLCMFFMQATTQARAADEEQNTAKEVQVSPTRFDWQLASGESRSGVINIKNYADSDYQITIAVEDFYVSDDSLQANFFVPDSNHPLAAYDVINWVAPEEREFTIKAGEAKNLNFTINVPADAPTGGYYGGIFVQHEKIEDNPSAEGSKVKINTRAGVLLILGVQGAQPIMRNGIMEKITSEKPIYFDKPAKVVADILNSGNLQYRMSGELQLSHFDKVVEKIEVRQNTVYPNKLRHFESLWNFSLFDFGKYTATMKLTSEEGDVTVLGETSFWVIPWKTVATGVGIITFLWIIYKLGGRKEKKRTARKTAR